MHLKSLEINGFKSFAKKSSINFDAPISAIVGPNGSGKSNIAESFRFVLGEQSFKSMRGKRGEDLIFGGTQGAPKMNRASVKLVFDNKDKSLPVDFDEVSLERVVHRDGVNEYHINGSSVRLKDITELLASANIGSSGHHIISQGEADRILNSSVKERREMLEEALGLRVFQYKKRESERKLEKTRENVDQVQSLRREIAPHIKFLKKQVEKIEEGKKMREELLGLYRIYLKIESEYIKREKGDIESSVRVPKQRLEEINREIERLEKETQNNENTELVDEIKSSENLLLQVNGEKNDLIRKVGQLEGQINSLIKLRDKSKEVTNTSVTISNDDVKSLRGYAVKLNDSLDNYELLQDIVREMISEVNRIVSVDESGEDLYTDDIRSAKEELGEIEKKLKDVEVRQKDINEKLSALKVQLEEDKSSSLEAEKEIVKLMTEKNQVSQQISEFAIREDGLKRDEELYQNELRESVVLVGRDVTSYEEEDISEYLDEERSVQIDRRRDLERLKIKVEESSGGNSEDVVKEYDEVTERDEFLIKEIEDLEKSAASLEELIKDLEIKIETKFKEGLKKINDEFSKFFKLMFGGGDAGLNLVKIPARKKKDTDLDIGDDYEEEQEAEEGVDIKVNLPRKKIRDLMMLSGGERALSSIALLFAISQVNPPPFIILDETDAALDEANSRKYGDMIESLSEYSQLILITHNRETMSRAGVIYGVTMIQGVSQLLSIALSQGVEYAK